MKKLILLLLLIGGGYGFFKYYLPKYGVSGVLKSVQGIQTTIQTQDYKQLLSTDKQGSSTSALPISLQAAQSIQQQVEQLKGSEIASSSPKIQEILKKLKSLPHNAGIVKNTCVQLCGKL